ncbi:GGDEF domain-containing protein [Bowmanella denitrificans]|uniref:GGDEF domain-containing protein n=1 Tax=Bowmanella denitrificans TaxID=366582 RepID=UPI000C9CE270|nr:sensor domain-containing diguanylate cyclase [Bowmanella denitrificans]
MPERFKHLSVSETSQLQKTLNYAVQFLVLAFSYALFSYLGVKLATLTYNISLIWPPVGIAVALLLRWDMRLWPAILLGGIFQEMVVTGYGFLLSLTISVASLSAIYFACYLLKRLHFDVQMERSKDFYYFTLIAVIGCPLLMALMGVGVLTLNGVIPQQDFPSAALSWFLGDITGMLVFGIALLVFNLNRLAALLNASNLLVFAMMLLIGLELFVFEYSPVAPALALLPVLGLLWIALRTNLAATSWVVLSFSALAFYAALNHQGIFSSLQNPPLGTWFYVNSLALVALIVSVSAMESRLESEQMQYSIQSTNIGTWDWRLQDQRVLVNSGWHHLLGLSHQRREISLGEFISLVHPEDLRIIENTMDNYLNQQTHEFSCQYRMYHKSGDWRIIQSTGKIIEWDLRGRALRMCGTHLDVTDSIKTQQELTQTYTFLNRVSEQIPGAIYQFILDKKGHGHFPYVNQGMVRMLGVSAEKLKEDAKYGLTNVHPDDVSKLVKTILKNSILGKSWRYEFRVVKPRAGWREIHSRPHQLEDGQVVWFGYMTDITDHKHLEQSMRLVNQKLQSAQRAAKLGYWNGNLVTGDMSWSDILFELYGYRPGAVEASFNTLLGLVPEEEKQALKDGMAWAVRTGELNIEHRIVTTDGEIRWFHQLAKVSTANHHWFEGSAQDITERKTLELRFQTMALTDELTGIANRRAFLQQLEREWGRFKRKGSHRVFVTITDIDHFKQVNDTYGHDVGDKVLRHFTDLIGEHIRKGDVFGRMGGEEFALMLIDSDQAQVINLLEKLRGIIQDTPLQVTMRLSVSITASFGVARFNATQRNFDDALIAADQALYQAKGQGRNRVCLESSNASQPHSITDT